MNYFAYNECMDMLEAIPQFSFQMPAGLPWIVFLIVAGIVGILSLVLIWHWNTYHPRKSVVFVVTGIYSIVTIALLSGIATAVRAL